MSYGRRLTLSCDWPMGLDLNAGAPPSERRDVVGLSMHRDVRNKIGPVDCRVLPPYTRM